MKIVVNNSWSWKR